MTQKPKQKEVTIFAHFKQGDDLNHIIRENPDMSHIGALYSWADMLEGSARSIREAADVLCENSQEVEIHADTHHIGLHHVDTELYDKLERVDVVNLHEWEWDEEEELYEEGDCDALVDQETFDVISDAVAPAYTTK